MKIIFCLFFCLTKTSVFSNQKFKTVFKQDNAFLMFGINLQLRNNDQKQDQIFNVDLSQEDIIVADKSQSTWGISCEDQCQKKDLIEDTLFYRTKAFQGQNASGIFLFDHEYNNIQLDKKQDFILIEKEINPWVGQDWGVLGLSPQSKFMKNQVQILDSNLLVQIEVNKNPEFSMIINPSLQASNLILQQEVNEKHWVFKGSLKLEGTDIDFKNEKICVSNTDYLLIKIEYGINYCEQLKQIMCEDINNCNSNTADLSKLKPMVFYIKNQEIKFQPEDYMYLNGQNYICMIGDISSSRIFEECPQDAKISVSNYFLSEVNMVIEYTKEGKSQIRFYKKPQEHFLLIVLLFLVFMTVCIMIVICLYMAKKRSDQRFFTEIDEYKKLDLQFNYNGQDNLNVFFFNEKNFRIKIQNNCSLIKL